MFCGYTANQPGLASDVPLVLEGLSESDVNNAITYVSE
jgi:hypothetical protein